MDVVVTVPKSFEYANQRGLAAWISEGDAAGEPWSGQEWYFTLWGHLPRVEPGDRVYIVCNGQLRGYAPLTRIEKFEDDSDLFDLGDSEEHPPRRVLGAYALVRKGNAVAVTVSEPIKGFRGFRYRWWKREDEKPFPDWKIA